MAREIFVSYSQPDRECALELVSELEANDFGVWIAPRDISPSADWAEEIIDAISAARVMVLVFSSHSNASPQVRREVERAVHKQLPVLAFRIEDALPSRSLEYFLSSQHWMDAFPPPRGPHYARLRAHLSVKLHGAPAADPKDTGRSRILDPALAASLTPAELQLVERHLAYHIGPVASLLVRRAAAGAIDRDHLTTQLAAELDSDSARREFIEACRTLPRPTG